MTKDDIIKKLSSRKFWLSAAAFLGSVAVSISGIATDNHTVTSIGIACGVLSAAIYAAAEAYVDGKAVKQENKDEHETVA